ncbi:MAG: tRNA dihydrouridine synthase DusB [Gammaproteobacteria bacterium]|nr:tRNA dihydrouridine synthase DusB [Gammaproteobacteria bacterium]MDD9897307.1 tRNA dihydrouridine synthase DusB [Gammaproteobacteria bacterium]MDD9959447.1 tRNA dihydrouridine synthase DusB [Gammaproteobacteria bacterium]
MQSIGPYQLKNSLFLAPMVGVSDTPFREICTAGGAGLTIAEMLTSNAELWTNERNRLKQVRPRINGPHVVQIAGSDPAMLSDAAKLNVQLGANAIDINMGCPAKKVLKKAAGSALLKDIKLVERILKAVVNSVDVPVTLKIRTGWSPQTRNGEEIAMVAEDCGVQLLTVHGRTRACRFKGEAEYDTIAKIKQKVSIPVIANGDIDTAEKAKQVLAHTDADGVMIGRAAMGQPWIFDQIAHYLVTGIHKSEPNAFRKLHIIESHLKKLYSFYGETKGVWYARKHVAGYVKNLPVSKQFLSHFNQLEEGPAQLDYLQSYFESLAADDGAIAA